MMRVFLRVPIVALFCALVITFPVQAQTAPLGGLDAYIASAMDDWEIPGLSIAVVAGDEIVYARGFGVLEAGASAPVDEHSLFPIASTTKAFTAAALGLLVEEDELAWDDRVIDHLPNFRLGDAYLTQELTIRDLLTHRSGLGRHDNIWIAAPFDRDEIIRRARYLPVVSRFRDNYGYNNIMYITAGEVVAAVSGMSWDDFMDQRLFGPLGMTRSTTRAATVEATDNVVTTHTRSNGAITPMQRRNYDNIGGAGAGWSSASEMARWVRMHLNGGELDGMQILQPRTVRQLHTPQVLVPWDSSTARLFPGTHLRSYGLGWNVQDYHGRRLVHHTGSINYARTHVAMLPDEGVGVVVIANLSSSSLQHALVYRVMDAFLGVELKDWNAEYLELARRSNERSAEQARRRNEARDTDSTPSLALEEYAGRYTSDLYGDIELAAEGGRLVLRYSDVYTGDLEHWHHDTFRTMWRPTGFGSMFVSFMIDEHGNPVRMQTGSFGAFRRGVDDS